MEPINFSGPQFLYIYKMKLILRYLIIREIQAKCLLKIFYGLIYGSMKQELSTKATVMKAKKSFKNF